MNYFFNFVTGRSHKERSSYAPKGGLRYDGSYWIEKCWRKIGIQGFKVCRYLFVRCDNNDAPWTSDEYGDWPRPLPEIPKLENAVDITKRKEGSSWDFNMSMETGQLNMRRACRRSIFSLIIQRHSCSLITATLSYGRCLL
ncbi:hypothetical protein ACOSQ4_026746 [Xanthoceras sorbifolium]